MRMNITELAVLVVCGAWFTACAETTSMCGDGESVAVGESNFCVYKEKIVIVGGFNCPAAMPFRRDFERATVCGDHGFDNINIEEDICARVFVPCTDPDVARECEFPFADCNGVSADSCETPINTLSDCGSCGAACSWPNAAAGCDDGQCTLLACDVGFADCDTDRANGCESALNTLSNCGECGTVCSGENATCETGTCVALPARANCSSGTVYTSVGECENTPLTCYVLPGGETCGVCTSELDCAQIDCSAYSAPVLPLQECLDGLGAWEGLCGSVRYRSTSGGYTGSTLYWDNASGTLLAAVLWSDTPAFCDGSAISVVQGDATVPAGCDLVADATTRLCSP